MSDSFQHLDRHDLIEMSVHLTVIGMKDLDSVIEPFLANPVSG